MNDTHRFIRLLATSAVLSLLAGSSTANDTVSFMIGDRMADEGGQWDPKSSPLQSPFGVDFDSKGDMYIVELGGGRVHKLAATGVLETLNRNAEKGYRGDGDRITNAQFNGMHNCVVTRDDRLMIADSWNHCVRQVDLKTDIITTLAGTGDAGFSGDAGSAKSATFDFIMCIALNAAKSTLHIADLKNRRVRDLDLDTGIVRTVAGNGKKAVPADGELAVDSPLIDPRAVASDEEGNLYILERNGNALRVVRPDGTIHTVAGSGKKGFRDGRAMQAQFAGPKHICCDSTGNVYIADDMNRAIRKFDPKRGEVTTVLGRGFGDKMIKLEHPHGVRWHDGQLYVVDTGHNRILRLR